MNCSNTLSHHFLAEIVTEFLQKNFEANSWREIIEVFTSSDNLKIIFEASIGGDISKVCSGVKILTSILNCSACDFLLREYKQQNNDEDVIQEEQEENNTEFLNRIIGAISGYATILRRPSEKFFGTLQQEVEMLGEDRLRIIDLMLVCIKLNNKEINSKIAQAGIIEEIMQLFFRLEMNSLLHHTVEKIVNAIFAHNNEDESLIECLINKSQLIALLAQNKASKGYSGHANRIANFLVKIQEKYEKIKFSIISCNEWNEYYANYLIKINETETKALGEEKQIESFEEFSKTEDKITAFLKKMTGQHNKKREEVSLNTKTTDEDDLINKEPETEECFEPEDPAEDEVKEKLKNEHQNNRYGLETEKNISENLEEKAQKTLKENENFEKKLAEIEEDINSSEELKPILQESEIFEIKIEKNYEESKSSEDSEAEENLKYWKFGSYY